MSLSGFDSEAVGFESVTSGKRNISSSCTQTSEFAESGVGSQTTLTADQGSTATPEDLNAGDDVLKEYPPPGLNAFLRRVVPAMMEQLDLNEKEAGGSSSDSDEEEAVQAKFIQEMTVSSDATELGSGDQPPPCILSVSWSSGGRSVAVALGRAHHDSCCDHAGVARVYSCAGGQWASVADLAHRSCVTVVKYHPSLAAVLAYGTSSGEVVVHCVRDEQTETARAGAGSVTALMWPDPAPAHALLTRSVRDSGRRRGAADQILISAGSDGTMSIWLVNLHQRVFENIVTFALNSLTEGPAPDISCFDFIKSYPLRPCDEKLPDDLFIVGTSTGALYSCRVSIAAPSVDGALDPVKTAPHPHAASVLCVEFSAQRPGVYATLGSDAELRIYRVDRIMPVKVFDLAAPVSCMAWLPGGASTIVVGARQGDAIRLHSAANGRRLALSGVEATAPVTAIDVAHAGTCRVACGDSKATLRIWEIPTHRIRLSPEDLDY